MKCRKKKHVKVVQMAMPGEAAVDRWRDIGTRYRPGRKYTTESDWKKKIIFSSFFCLKKQINK